MRNLAQAPAPAPQTLDAAEVMAKVIDLNTVDLSKTILFFSAFKQICIELMLVSLASCVGVYSMGR